jgi:hypothetical protein
MSQTAKSNEFPLVEAFLELPEEGAEGHVAICTNTVAAGQVRNEVAPSNAAKVAVLGPVIVNRGGAERMIINGLAHPTVRDIVLFGTETSAFAPSTNLLHALQNGIDPEGGSNRIVGGQGSSAVYPNLSPSILDQFRGAVRVVPLYGSKTRDGSERPAKMKTVDTYLGWLAQRGASDALVEFLAATNHPKAKVHYRTLNDLLAILGDEPRTSKPVAELDSKDFQELQPPIIEVGQSSEKPGVPFHVELNAAGNIVVTLSLGAEVVSFVGDDEFDLAYTIVKAIGDKKELLSPLEQLVLGAELGRMGVEMRSSIATEPLSQPRDVATMPVPTLMQHSRAVKMDEDYYYTVRMVGGKLSVLCMANDRCAEVFDLRSQGVIEVLRELAERNRFQAYELDMLHRLDVGTQIAKARIAADNGQQFMQDFVALFASNTSTMPLIFAEADSFMGAHRSLVAQTYTTGLEVKHADAHKGLTRTVGVLAVFRAAQVALGTTPLFYQQGNEPTEVTRAAYAEQLMRRDDDDSYSYGNRTREHFGFDQLTAVIEALRRDPTRAAIIQRFDPSVDMSWHEDPERPGKRKYSHDPCLSHDIYWIGQDGKLHSFHVARAHNLVNAYPDNIYGLHDAYVQSIAQGLGIEIGDMYMLSSRGNILLLSEDTRARAIIAAPSKPYLRDTEYASGPVRLSSRQQMEAGDGVAAYYAGEFAPEVDMNLVDKAILARLRSYRGIDTIERALDYLEDRGGSHNNPLVSTYYAGESNIQGDELVFLQINVFAGKLYATAVYANHDTARLERDKATCTYIANLFAKKLGVEKGQLVITYAPTRI